MSPHALKSIQVQEAALRTKLQQAKKEVSDKTSLSNQLKHQRDTLLAEIQSLNLLRSQLAEELKELQQTRERATQKAVTVSEHALLRYAERVLGVNLTSISEALLSPSNLEMIRWGQGTCRIHTAEGITLVVENNVIVSVLD